MVEYITKRQQLPEEVASYVREMILSGEVRPGDFLRMEPIAEAVGVSNTPVREGLLMLSSEGFIRQVPRRGFVVATFTQQDIRDIFWAQAQLAGELAARAAKRITPEQLAALSDIEQRYERAIEARDEDQIAHLGHYFHRGINLAADSHRLALLLGSVVRHLPNRFYASIESQVAATKREHPMILDAVRRGDGPKARKLMQHHINENADHVIETLEHRGMWKTEGEKAAS